jgi:hypothetical protein
MKKFSLEALQMLKECNWKPAPDWHYYRQHALELNLELCSTIEEFLNTYEGLEIYYIPPQIEEDEVNNDDFDESYYYTSFYFSTSFISSIKFYNIPLVAYNRKTNKRFLPIGEFSGQFGQPSWATLIVMNELGEIHIIDWSEERSWFEFKSIEAFFNAIALECIAKKVFFNSQFDETIEK